MFCPFAIIFIFIFALYKFILWVFSKLYINNYSSCYILVTGCDTGFGNLLAKRLDQLGCHVIAGCLTENGETDLKKSSSGRLETISLDVTKKESVRKAFNYVKARLPSGKGLWGVVNNAGSLTRIGPNDWLTVDDFKSVCDVNLWGLVDVSLTFLPLVKIEKGRIVNMSSASGRHSPPLTTTYSVSKYGVEAFTDGIRRDLRSFGCKVSLIEPGGHKTPGSSKEAMRDAVVRTWMNAPAEIKDEYGEEYISFMRDIFTENMQSMMSDCVERVIDAYEHALFGRFPKARYVVGWDATLIFLLFQMVPEWLGDFFWGIVEKTRPTPKVLKQK